MRQATEKQIIAAFNAMVEKQAEFWEACRGFELAYGRDVDGVTTLDLTEASSLKEIEDQIREEDDDE